MKSNAETILEAIEDLHNQEQIVTRETLSQLTDLKLSIVDDRLSYLVDSGQIIRVQRGVFIPAPKHRVARLMSKMVLPDGTVKIEIGDDEVLTLTPREARNLGNLMVAEAMQYANIEMGHHMAILQSEISGQVRKLTRQVGDLMDSGKQGDLYRANREISAFRAKADIDRKIIKDYLNSDMTHKQVAELNGVSMSKVKKTLDHLASAFYLSNHDDIDYDKAMSIKSKVGCKSPKLQETINEFVRLYTS